MKVSIEGFDQSKSVELGLCVADMVLLRWFVDFSNTGAMEKRSIEGKEYYWVNYDYVLQELPILKISKKTLYRCFKELVDKEVLTHAFVQDGGSYSFYGFGKNFIYLVSNTGTSGGSYGTAKKPPTKSVKKKTVKKYLSKSEIDSKISESFKGEFLRNSFRDFMQMRDSIKKPVSTAVTLNRLIKRLMEFSGGDEEVADNILDQSIRNNWQDLYPLKDKSAEKVVSTVYDPAELARDESGNLRVF